MKIFVTGTRGIPDIQGGVETHCENLYPRIAKIGGDVTLIRRSCYIRSDHKVAEFRGVRLKDIYAPRIKSIEAIVHTFLAVWYAFFKGADVVHIHSVGPALLTPLAKMLGMKVVFTHHGADYEREKWGRLARMILKAGEYAAVRFADYIIVISGAIKKDILRKYKQDKNIQLIHNGVNDAWVIKTTGYIETLGLMSRKYIFALGRFVEEKGFHDLIDAYLQSSSRSTYKLVIAGDADHETKYSQSLKQKAKNNGIVLPGMVKGIVLAELYSHARMFVLPSSHEGMPISLLEAMSYNLDVVVSDIPANKVLIQDCDSLFEPGIVQELTVRIDTKLQSPFILKDYDLSDYNWDKIAEDTFDILKLVEK